MYSVCSHLSRILKASQTDCRCMSDDDCGDLFEDDDGNDRDENHNNSGSQYSRRGFLIGGLALVVAEETIREWIYGDGPADNRAEEALQTTIWDIDDWLNEEQASQREEAQKLSNHFSDTAEDRTQTFDSLRNGRYRESSGFPDGEISDPAFELHDLFYSTKYIAHDNVVSGSGEEVSADPAEFTHGDARYQSLTAQGYPVPELEGNDERDMTMAVQEGMNPSGEELWDIHKTYSALGHAAKDLRNGEFDAQSNIENAPLSDLSKIADDRVEEYGRDSYAAEQVLEAKQDVQDAESYLTAAEEHYLAASGLIQNAVQDSSRVDVPADAGN